MKLRKKKYRPGLVFIVEHKLKTEKVFLPLGINYKTHTEALETKIVYAEICHDEDFRVVRYVPAK
jgi:hypothetical protein